MSFKLLDIKNREAMNKPPNCREQKGTQNISSKHNNMTAQKTTILSKPHNPITKTPRT
ncbi:hypothetical protein Sjap_005619 [Stephania japonica]|uniref:Uncharacterized protein n=1 Tax=Stephania japonica TaxID=461633 RepID=A0AAP0K4M4_9MAGN